MRDDPSLTRSLEIAIRNRDQSTVEAVVRQGADVNGIDSDGFRMLTAAAVTGHLGILKTLLQSGARQDANASRTESAIFWDDPLYWAAKSGQLDVARLLVSAGFRVIPHPEFRETVLHIAAEVGSVPLIDVGLEAGGSDFINLFDYLRHTPLIRAVLLDKYEAIQRLLDAGADINAADSIGAGDTAIKLAAAEKGPTMIEFLLDSGADPRIRGWMGLTAYDAAKRRNDALGVTVLELLKRAHPTGEDAISESDGELPRRKPGV